MTKLPVNAKLLGHVFKTIDVTWDHKDTILYALGVGATPEGELDFLYEGRGPKVLPDFAVIAGGRGLADIMEYIDLRMESVLHGDQAFSLMRPIPPRASGRLSSKIVEVWDKGKAAVLGIESVLEDSDGVLLTTYSSIFVQGAGGFGGERGPAAGGKNAPPERGPDLILSEKTLPQQGALYRLTGAWNPVHIDPEVARLGGYEAPFMHGLCTYGFVARAALKALCGGDPARFKSMTGRFSGLVLFGDTIITKIWKTAPGVAVILAETQKGNTVLSQAKVTFSG